MCPFSPKAKQTFFLIRVHPCSPARHASREVRRGGRVCVLIVLSFETWSVQLFCKYGINPYLQPLNQSTNQPIDDIWNRISVPAKILLTMSPDGDKFAFQKWFRCLEFIFVHFVAKYFFTSNAGSSENCLKFKMPKVPKIEVFCRFYSDFAC